MGATESALRHRLATGEWAPVTRRVLRLAGTAETPEQRLLAAVLDAGTSAVASHESAAALWALPGFWLRALDVSRQHVRSRRRTSLGRLHHPDWLPEHHLTVVHDIPCTTLARTLFDLAGREDARRVERAVDNALARSPALLPALHRMLDELAEHGRAGIAVMRTLLAERPADHVPPASGLEARAIAILDHAGIRTERQVDIGHDAWIGRVDLRVAGTDLLIEVDSALHHTSLSDRRRDAARDEALAAAGFRVVRVTDRDVWNRPHEVVRAIRAVLPCRSGARAPVLQGRRAS
jgi:very-short-patch-repair endonuclease